ncbi:MAG: tyrosine-type recombinase/integrase [Candidatus Woesearchaeota archaeon]
MEEVTALECIEKFEQYLNYRQDKNDIALSTAYSYKRLLLKFKDYILNLNIQIISEIKEEHVTKFLEQIKSIYTYSTVRYYIFVLQKFFEFLVNKRIIKNKKNPMLFFELPKQVQSEPISLSNLQVRNLIESAKKELFEIIIQYEKLEEKHNKNLQKNYSKDMMNRIVKNYNNKVQAFAKKYIKELRNYSMLSIMLSFGCRRGELKFLKVKSLNFEDKTIKFLNVKTKQYQIITGLDDLVFEILQEYIEYANLKDDHFLFVNSRTNKPLSDMGCSTIIKNYLKKSGLGMHKVHTLRKTVASFTYKQTKDLVQTASRMRDSSLSLVFNVYLHIDEDELRDAVGKFPVSSNFDPNFIKSAKSV